MHFFARVEAAVTRSDAYSHKIVGWAIGPTLETIYPLQALGMSVETIDDDTASRLIHHSDRGCQYCSATYVAELKKQSTVADGVNHIS